MLGKTATAATIVSQSNAAKAVGSGSLDVFATPMMIALMEQAACACLEDILEPGQTSVGTHVCVDHTAASAVGAEVTATATVTSLNKRSVEFSVSACDSAGAQIGSGRHVRVIVDIERFMRKVQP